MPAAVARAKSAKTKLMNGKVVSSRSKTGSSECSAAMSEWVTTRKSGSTPASVFAILGQCRAKARALKQASQHKAAGNEAKAQRLEAIAAGKKGPVTAKDRMALAKEKRATLNAQRAANPIAAQVAASVGAGQASPVATKAKASPEERIAAVKAKVNRRGEKAMNDAKFYGAFGGPRAQESAERFNRIKAHVPTIKAIEARVKSGQPINAKSQPVAVQPATKPTPMIGSVPASQRLANLPDHEKAYRKDVAKEVRRVIEANREARAAKGKYKDRSVDSLGRTMPKPGERVVVQGQGMFGVASVQSGEAYVGKNGSLMVRPGSINSIMPMKGVSKASSFDKYMWRLPDDPAVLASRAAQTKSSVKWRQGQARRAVNRSIPGTPEHAEHTAILRADAFRQAKELRREKRHIAAGIREPEGQFTKFTAAFNSKEKAVGFDQAYNDMMGSYAASRRSKLQQLRADRAAKRTAQPGQVQPSVSPRAARYNRLEGQVFRGEKDVTPYVGLNQGRGERFGDAQVAKQVEGRRNAVARAKRMMRQDKAAQAAANVPANAIQPAQGQGAFTFNVPSLKDQAAGRGTAERMARANAIRNSLRSGQSHAGGAGPTGDRAYRVGMARAERSRNMTPREASVNAPAPTSEPWVHTGSRKSPGTGAEIYGEAGPQRQIKAPTARFTAARMERAKALRAERAAKNPQAAPVAAKPTTKATKAKTPRAATPKSGAKVKPVKGEVALSLTVDGEKSRKSVPATIVGDFAVHAKDRSYGGKWRISDTRSGGMFHDATTKAKAIKAAAVLNKYGVSEQTSFVAGGTDARAAARVANVLRRDIGDRRMIPVPPRTPKAPAPVATPAPAPVAKPVSVAPAPKADPFKAAKEARQARKANGVMERNWDGTPTGNVVPFKAKVEMAKVERNARRQERAEAKAPPKPTPKPAGPISRVNKAIQENRDFRRRSPDAYAAELNAAKRDLRENRLAKVREASSSLKGEDRKAYADKVKQFRRSMQSTPTAQARIAEQRTRADARDRANFPLFGGQTPNERPYVATPPTPSLRAQADAFREKNRRFGNPETEAQYRKQLADQMRKTRPRGAQGISEEGKRNYQTAENSDLELTVRQTQSMPKSFGTRSLARKYGEFAKSILAQRAEAVAAKLAATRAIPRGTPGRIRIASDAKEARRLGVTKAADALTIGRTTEGIRSGALPKDTLTDYLKSQQKVLKNQESAIFRARDDSDRKYAENAAAKARRKVELANITKTLLSRKPMKPARTAARS